MIAARALEKTYPTSPTPAVAGIEFEIEARQCFGFLGPNGAGKTTTMQMICCRVRRTAGELQVLGLDPNTDDRSIKGRIGVVPQETNLDSVLSVEENLIVYGRYFGLSDSKARERAKDVLDFVQLSDRANWQIDHLSGGMKRRLLIGRGLINEPEVMILDEPTTGLDPQARHLVWEKLRDLKRRGVTLVLTTHYMEEAAQLCDRLVIMHQGRILVEGAPSELTSKHVAPEVLELSAGDLAELEALQEAVAEDVEDLEIAGDRLVLHTTEGETMLKRVNATGLSYETATLRPATLEDVFLKLAGRALEE